MIKKTIKYLLYFLILITIGVFYLSYYGIETKRFNQVIKDKISETNNKIDIELNKVKIILNLSNFTIGIKTKNPNINIMPFIGMFTFTIKVYVPLNKRIPKFSLKFWTAIECPDPISIWPRCWRRAFKGTISKPLKIPIIIKI